MSKDHDEFAGRVVGFHIGVGSRDLVELVRAIDRHGQAAGGDVVLAVRRTPRGK